MRTTGIWAVGLVWAGLASAHVFETDNSGTALRWDKPFEFVIDARLAEDTGEPAAPDAIEAAVDSYRGLSDGLEIHLSTAELPPLGKDVEARDGKSTVRVLTDWPWDADIVARTHLEQDTVTHELVEADIFLNGSHAFRRLPDQPSGSQLGYYDLQAIVTHELGHAVGLAHNTDLDSSVMYPTTHQGEVTKRLLIDDDRQGVAALYAMSAASRAGCSAAGGGPELALLMLIAGAAVGLRRGRA